MNSRLYEFRDYLFCAFKDHEANCDPASYEERIVMFVDILGFKSLIDSTLDRDIENQSNISRLVGCFNKALEDIFDVSHRKYVQFSQFSDSFVVSHAVLDREDVDLLFHAYVTVFIIAKLIIKSFLRQEILVRGGICQGKVFHREGYLLFGPAMNKAYLLESTRAKYPRIIVDNEIIKNITAKLGSIPSDTLKEIGVPMSVDDDGEVYLDYMNEFPRRLLNKFPRNSPSLVEKYEWLSRKCK